MMEDFLTVLCSTVPVEARGDILNSAAQTAAFTGPLKDVIRVSVEHFSGVSRRGLRS